MKKATLIISISLVLALVAGSVFAWGHGKGRNGMWGDGDCPRFGKGGAAADLTQEQQDQLANLRQKYVDDTYELRSAQLETRQQIRLLMQTSNPDRAKLDSLFNEIDATQKQLRDKKVEFILEAKKIAPDAGFGYGRGFGKKRGGCQRYGGGNKGNCGGGSNCVNQ